MLRDVFVCLTLINTCSQFYYHSLQSGIRSQMYKVLGEGGNNGLHYFMRAPQWNNKHSSFGLNIIYRTKIYHYYLCAKNFVFEYDVNTINSSQIKMYQHFIQSKPYREAQLGSFDSSDISSGTRTYHCYISIDYNKSKSI